MKDIVIHIREDICAKYGRDPEATKFIEVAKEFGIVETLDSALSAERINQKTIIQNLKKQYEDNLVAMKTELDSIRENKVTAEELEILKAIRKKSNLEAAVYETAIKTRDDQLNAVAIENENRAKQIKALFGI